MVQDQPDVGAPVMAEAASADFDDEEYQEYEDVDSVSTLGAIIFTAVLGAGIGGFFGTGASGLLGLIIGIAQERGITLLLAMAAAGAVTGALTGFVVGSPLGMIMGLVSELRWTRVSLPLLGAILAGCCGVICGIGGGLIVAMALGADPNKLAFIGGIIGLLAGILGGFVLGLFTKAQLELREERMERFQDEAPDDEDV